MDKFHNNPDETVNRKNDPMPRADSSNDPVKPNSIINAAGMVRCQKTGRLSGRTVVHESKGRVRLWEKLWR